MEEPSDEMLLQMLKGGKEEALLILHDRYAPILLFEAYQVLKRKDEAEDVVQNVFIRFWHGKHYFSVEQSLKLFLYRSVKNEALNIIRYRKRQAILLDGYKVTLNQNININVSENNELGRAIRRAHRQLPPQQRMAFQLFVIEKRKKKDVAENEGLFVCFLEGMEPFFLFCLGSDQFCRVCGVYFILFYLPVFSSVFFHCFFD